MTRFRLLMAAGLACTACSADHGRPVARLDTDRTAGCIPGGGGFLHARLRGAVVADLDWNNADMQCDGGPRPDRKGMRLTFAGRLQGTTHQLRFIFGIDPQDIASGPAQVMPTNLTVILEGEQQLFATRGSEHCAVETLESRALEQTGNKRYRVHARGYCLGPATNVAGDEHLLLPTFEFTGTVAAEPEQ